MLTVLFSPHMTSVDNEARRASGHADVPLTEVGRQRARDLGMHYASEEVDAVFCSDLRRAVETAEIVFSARGVPIVCDARLREYDYGTMTQHPLAEVEAEFVQRVDEPFPGGESWRMVVQRMGAFLRDVMSGYDGKTVVVIGHRATRYGLEYWCGGGSLEEIVRGVWPWLEIPIWRYELDTGKLERS